MKQTTNILGDVAYYEAVRKADALREQLRIYLQHSRHRARVYRRMLRAAEQAAEAEAERLTKAADKTSGTP